MSHPAVLDTAVVSKSHPSDIHHMTAFVVLNPDNDVTARELHDFANGRYKLSVCDKMCLYPILYTSRQIKPQVEVMQNGVIQTTLPRSLLHSHVLPMSLTVC